MKLGPVIWVRFCLGQADLTQFIKHSGLTHILHESHALIMVFGPDQSNELSMLDGDDGSYLLLLLKNLDGLTVQLEYFSHSLLG